MSSCAPLKKVELCVTFEASIATKTVQWSSLSGVVVVVVVSLCMSACYGMIIRYAVISPCRRFGR